MSDPTQAGAPDETPQAQEMPAPSWSAYSPQQLLKIINNGVTQYGPTHPQHGEARALVQQARAELARQLAEQNHKEYLGSHDLGPLAAGAVHFGDVASLGLLGQNSPIPGLRGMIDPQFLQASNEQHGLASLIGGGLGGAADMMLLAPVAGAAGLGTIGTGAATGTALGATEGAIRAQPGQRERGAVIGGVTGLAAGTAGGVTGRVLGATGRGLGRIANKALGKPATGALSKEAAAAAQAIGVKVSEEGEEMVGGMPVGELRARLVKQMPKASPQEIESSIDAVRKAVTRTASGGVTVTGRAGEQMSATPGYAGNPKGVDVTGSGPTLKTITKADEALAAAKKNPWEDVSDRIKQLQEKRARFESRGYSATPGEEIPQPSGGVTVTPKGAPQQPSQIPEAWQAARQVSAPIAELQDKLGRTLTPEELERVHATLSPHSPSAAARSAHALSEAAGATREGATSAARRAAGTHSTFDPRQGL